MNIINPYRFGGIPTNGLIAEYLFDTDASDTAGDAGGPYDGTLQGDAAVSSGVLTLDGTDDYVTIADNDIFSFTDGAGTDNPFSISLWVKSTVAASAQNLVTKGDFGGTREYQFQFLGGGNAGKLAITLYTSSGSEYIYAIGTTAYTQNQWHHYVVTYDGSESETGITLYFDDSDDTATRGETGTYLGMSNSAVAVGLGARFSFTAWGVFLTGDMDNVRIYDRELSAAEVTQLFNEGHS